MDEFLWFVVGGVAGSIVTLIAGITYLYSIFLSEDEHD